MMIRKFHHVSYIRYTYPMYSILILVDDSQKGGRMIVVVDVGCCSFKCIQVKGLSINHIIVDYYIGGNYYKGLNA